MKKIYGHLSARPAKPEPGTIFHDTDTDIEYYFESTWRQIPLDGDDTSLYVKKTDLATTTKVGVVKKASKVDDAAGETPTAAEFNALIAALKSAGIMSST